MREKIKNGKVGAFNLTEEEHRLLAWISVNQGMSKSDCLGWLIKNFMVSNDPIKELEELKKERNILNNKLLELDNKESIVLNKIKLHKEDIKNREKLKEKAIINIARKFQEGADYLEIENIAQFWSFRLNCDKKELMYKAGLVIKQ